MSMTLGVSKSVKSFQRSEVKFNFNVDNRFMTDITTKPEAGKMSFAELAKVMPQEVKSNPKYTNKVAKTEAPVFENVESKEYSYVAEGLSSEVVEPKVASKSTWDMSPEAVKAETAKNTVVSFDMSGMNLVS